MSYSFEPQPQPYLPTPDSEHIAYVELLMEAYFLPTEERREHEAVVAELIDDQELYARLKEKVVRTLEDDDMQDAHVEDGIEDERRDKVLNETKERPGVIMGSMSPPQFIKAMRRLGFITQNSRGDHVHLINPESGERTYVSSRRPQMSRGLVCDLIARANITVDEFLKGQSKKR